MLIKNLRTIEGKGSELLFTCLDNSGEIINLTGLTGVLTVYRDDPKTTNTTILTKSATLVVAAEGTCKVTLTDSDMNLTPQQYFYELSFTFDTGENRVLFKGDFIILGDDVDNRIKQIKATYGLNYDYYIMKEALDYAREEAKGVYENVITESADASTTIKICHNVMDDNNDGAIDEDDVNVFQYMKESPYTVEDLNSHVSSITLDNPYIAFITLDDEYPSENYTLRVEYKLGRKPYDDLKPFIFKLEEWYVIKYLFQNLDVYKLQHGMTSKDINGINVVFDQNGITNFQKKITDRITYYTMKITPYTKCKYNNMGNGGIMKSVLIPKSYD